MILAWGLFFIVVVLVVFDLEGLVDVAVVEHAKDVLAGAVDAPAEKEVGKAEGEVLQG